MRNIIVRNKQTLFDLAIQYCGQAESVFDVALANGLSITDRLTPGETLKMPPVEKKRIVEYFAVNQFIPATEYEEIQLCEGIGCWYIEIDFIVS
ncbi:MAG: hypothetical protein LUG18_15215 [Candidatus Azobacteroides sp.]|nr:hypothetical protein [Candidatus Azobacteroides sp.]